MNSKLRIYPGHIFAALLFLALVVMDRSVDDWGTLSNGFGNLVSFFMSNSGHLTGVCLNLGHGRSALPHQLLISRVQQHGLA